jgi:hypothetical protein
MAIKPKRTWILGYSFMVTVGDERVYVSKARVRWVGEDVLVTLTRDLRDPRVESPVPFDQLRGDVVVSALERADVPDPVVLLSWRVLGCEVVEHEVCSFDATCGDAATETVVLRGRSGEQIPP